MASSSFFVYISAVFDFCRRRGSSDGKNILKLARNLNNHFLENEINVVCTFRDSTCQSCFLTQFNVTKLRTGIKRIEQI